MIVVFSGGGTAGHFHPARNIAEALVGTLTDAEPFFVGTKGRIEARELPRLGYPYRLLWVTGLRRPGFGAGATGRLIGAAVANAKAMWLLLWATARLVFDFRRRGVRAVVLTGGYVSAPAGIAGALLRLPVVLQEQNMYPGLTTRLLSRWACQIHLAYPEAKAALPARVHGRVHDGGNPIRPLPPLQDRDRTAARRALGLPTTGPVVLFVGGSQGADTLNRAALDIVSAGRTTNEAFILWVTGPAHFEGVRASLAGLPAENVRAVPYLEPSDMYRALAAADLAVSRAGAMTTSEFLAWGLPAVLIPLPGVGAHQTRNAQALEAAGAALHLPERDPKGTELTGRRLRREVRRLLDSPGLLADMSAAARSRSHPDATSDIATAIARLLRPAASEAAS